MYKYYRIVVLGQSHTYAVCSIFDIFCYLMIIIFCVNKHVFFTHGNYYPLISQFLLPSRLSLWDSSLTEEDNILNYRTDIIIVRPHFKCLLCLVLVLVLCHQQQYTNLCLVFITLLQHANRNDDRPRNVRQTKECVAHFFDRLWAPYIRQYGCGIFAHQSVCRVR